MISGSLKTMVCALLLLPLIAVPAELAGDLRTLTLEDGLTLRLQRITPHRTTPRAYVEQGLETIEALGKQKVLMSRRGGTLGREVQYSLIAVTDQAAPSDVSIHGQVLIGPQAWEYQATTRSDRWQDSIPVVIEALSQLAVRPTNPGSEFQFWMNAFTNGNYNLIDAISLSSEQQDERIREAASKLVRSKVPTAREAVTLAHRALFAHSGPPDAQEGVRVMGLYSLAREAAGFGGKDDLVWEVHKRFGLGGVSGIVLVSASTGNARVLFPW